MRQLADSLVELRTVDRWMTVDYSASYRLTVNATANWDNFSARQQSHLHGVSFDDGQSNDVQMAFYFAIDWCPARYIAIFQLDQRLATPRGAFKRP